MNNVEKLFKRLFFITISIVLFILAILGIAVYFIDPYQQFRKSDLYINDARLEIPGISRHHNYNTILMGSSMAMNHEPRQIDSLFSTSDEPWITRNFSLIGGMSDDYNILLDRVFKDGKVKHIIFDFDYFSFARQQNVITDYLYTDNFFDKFKYIFNYTTLENCVRKYKNPVRVDNLYHFYAPNNRKELFNNYKKVKDEVFSDDGYNFDFSVMKSHFDKHLLRYIQKRSDIDWYIYFPPYSIFEFIRYRDGGHMAAISQFKKYVIEELLKQPNVNTYDFQPEVSWIMNFNEYTDVRHHSHAFNHAIIISLSRDEYLVTQDNYLDKIDSLNRIIKSVNADKLMKTHKKQ